MSDGESVPRVESKWASALEYAVFGFPAMVAISFLLSFYVVSQPSSGLNPFAGVAAMLILLSLVGGFVLSVIIAVSLYFDAKAVANADVTWNPSAALYGVGGFFLPGLVALHYLYKRYEHTAPGPTWDNWWYGVVACFTAIVVAGVATVLPVPTIVGAFGVFFVSAGVLPIVIYKDAVHVRGGDNDWLPNPVNYSLAVFAGSVLLVVPAAVTGYYLYKRHEYVGVP